MRRYRGRYLIVALLLPFQLPVFVALAVGAAVTRVLVGGVALARRAAGRARSAA